MDTRGAGFSISLAQRKTKQFKSMGHPKDGFRHWAYFSPALLTGWQANTRSLVPPDY